MQINLHEMSNPVSWEIFTQSAKHKNYLLVTWPVFVNNCCHNSTKYQHRQAWANSVDPDQTLQNTASDHGLHCLVLQQSDLGLHCLPLFQQFLDSKGLVLFLGQVCIAPEKRGGVIQIIFLISQCKHMLCELLMIAHNICSVRHL